MPPPLIQKKMFRMSVLLSARIFAFALLIALSFPGISCWSVDAAEHATAEEADDGKVKVSTKINLRLCNTYSKIEDLGQESTFKQLIEQCFDSELPRIEALAASSSSLSSSTSNDYKLSHVRVRILEQFWGDEYKIESSSSSPNKRRLQEGTKLQQPLIVRLIVTGRYAERGSTTQQEGERKLPSSADFYATIKSFFDSGGGDIAVDEYIPRIQDIMPGDIAEYFTEIEEIELLEQNGIVIRDDSSKRNEVGGRVSSPGLIAGCILLGIATICVLVMFVARRRKRHRFINGEFILTRGPSQPSADYLPSEIDLESVGGSIVSGMYYTSSGVAMLTKSEKDRKESSNLLPTRSSEEDTDKDESFTIGDDSDGAESSNGNHDSSFLQLQRDGNVSTTTANAHETVVYKDFSNTDIEAQAKARLMSYLAKYSDESGQEYERKEDAEEKLIHDEASRVSGEESTSAASFASQEASLLKNLGVMGDLAKEVEGSKGNESVSFSGTSKGDINDIASTEASLLKNLGVGTLPLLRDEDSELNDEEKSEQNNLATIDNEHVVTEEDDEEENEEKSNETEHNQEEEDMGSSMKVEDKSRSKDFEGKDEKREGSDRVGLAEGNGLVSEDCIIQSESKIEKAGEEIDDISGNEDESGQK